nr:MAG TPA: hypothetical protein [Caudoviricetes sp.]DAW61649.1 MAG TPA: hypothetical protein [Caudoviricetes sp.]
MKKEVVKFCHLFFFSYICRKLIKNDKRQS